MDKYIVKNCPSLRITKTGIAVECGRYAGFCQENTYCVIKKIVENMKLVISANHCNNCDGCGYEAGCKDVDCGTYQAFNTLELLKIKNL